MSKVVSWHLFELHGSTLSLFLYPPTTITIANGNGGDAMTETGNGMFKATVAESLTGWHKAYAIRAGVPVATAWVNMNDAAPVVVETIASDGTGESSGPTITLSPFYLTGINPASNLDSTMLVGEIKDVNINVFDAQGQPITEDDVSSYDALVVEVRNGAHVIESGITAALSGNVLTFRSTAAITAAPRLLKMILWGNATGIHARLGSGTIDVIS
jgi:hypothetical protein